MNDTGLAEPLDASVLEELLACEDYPFIRRAYWVLLGREPDPGGLANYLDRLRSGTPKVQVLAELARSPEGRAKGTLAPDRTLPEVVQPAPPAPATPGVMTYDELLAKDAQAFLACAYRTLLGRDPDPDGLQFYSGLLRTGVPKIQILAQLRYSEECAARTRGSRQDRHPIFQRLDREVWKFHLGRLPILGRLIRAAWGVEGSSPVEVRLRRLEFLLASSLAPEEALLRIPEAPAQLPGDPAGKISVTPPESMNGQAPPILNPPAVTAPATASLRSLPLPAHWGEESGPWQSMPQ